MANMRRKQGRHACVLRISRVLALSAHSARPPKMPGWIVPVRENFSVNKWVCRKQTLEIVLRGVCLFAVIMGTREKRSAHACLPRFRRIFAIEIIRDNKTN